MQKSIVSDVIDTYKKQENNKGKSSYSYSDVERNLANTKKQIILKYIYVNNILRLLL